MALNIFKLFNKKKAPPKGAEMGSMQSPSGGKSPAQTLAEGMVNVRDIIAPSAIEVDFNNVRVGNSYYRSYFISGYPRFVGANWLSPIINFDHTLNLSMFYYPVKSKVILDDLRKKITELEAMTMSNREKGRISDPVISTALDDAKSLQDQLVKGVEKYFQFSFYITIPANTLEELNEVCSKLESQLGALLLISKTASLQMEQALQSSLPIGLDKLLITRNMDTTSLATTFPFTSSDLTMEEGIMYGINRHNGSLIIFDRFSMENANSVVFAKSGAGKSYFVKLEALRLMVFGAEVMIIDPEQEYRPLCDAVGGNYIDFSANSPSKINPFDLSGIVVEGENELGQKLISLVTLLKLMMGTLNPTEEAILDRALIETYRIKGITTDPETQITREPPVMEDLYKVLLGAAEPEAKNMADRLEKFIRGSMTGIFDSQSNIDLNSKMTVFSTRNLEDALRPIAFYMILDFVWTRIKKDLRKRVLIVEEAWYLMQNEDSARFIYGIAKRARKYYLGLTTISQDVDDFLTSEYGKAIVTNSSIQILFKQHPAGIDKVAETFYLSEGEKRLLLGAGVGEGLFFAGSNHVAMKVMASEAEHKLITTNPEELLKLRQEGKITQKQPVRPAYQQYTPPQADKYETFDSKGNPKPEYVGAGAGQGVQQKPQTQQQPPQQGQQQFQQQTQQQSQRQGQQQGPGQTSQPNQTQSSQGQQGQQTSGSQQNFMRPQSSAPSQNFTQTQGSTQFGISPQQSQVKSQPQTQTQPQAQTQSQPQSQGSAQPKDPIPTQNPSQQQVPHFQQAQPKPIEEKPQIFGASMAVPTPIIEKAQSGQGVQPSQSSSSGINLQDQKLRDGMFTLGNKTEPEVKSLN